MGVIARQSIKGAIANYIGIAIGFLTTFFVLTDCLTQEEIGLTRVMVDVAMLFSGLAQLGTNASIIRFFPYFKSDDGTHHGIFGWALLIPCVGFLIFTLLFLVFRQPIETLYAEKSPLLTRYAFLLIPLTFFALYQTVFETCSSVLLRITVPKVIREVGIRLCNLVCYLLYGHGIISLDLFVILFCGSYALAMLCNFLYLLSLGHITFRIDRSFLNRRLAREAAGYTVFMTMTALAANIPLVNTLFLGAQEGLALTGVYTIAFYIANIVEVPYRSLGAISRPLVARAVKEDDWNEVGRLGRQLSVHQLLVSMMILFFIWINLPALYTFIPQGGEYAAGMSVVLIMGLAKVINSSLSVNTDVLSYSRHFSLSLPYMLLLTITAVLLNQWFIPLWGINGAAAATLVAYVVYYLALIAFVVAKLHVWVFSIRHLLVMAILALLVALHIGWRALLPLPHGMWALLADSMAQSFVLAVTALVCVYRSHISSDINSMVDRFLLRPLRLKKKM